MDRPNIIIISMDNLGYGDTGCYGCTRHRTPHIDRLGREGICFSSFYSTSGVCTPSRASLMTGCYPRRVNLHVGGTGHAVLMPVDPKGLHPSEITMGRLLKDNGYATACIGKWHLGDQLVFLPTRHGFEQFFGCPYSEDMVADQAHPDWPPLPLMVNEAVVEALPDRNYLTKRYTEQSIRFIQANRDRPFFLYLAHAMPGSSPRPFASPDFQGKSAHGSYADTVEELDWSCGQVVKTLKDLELDERTLLIWTSDNGAVGWDPPQGSNAPLAGWGYNTSEGAQRVPCIARWPGVIPAGAVRDDIVTMMDLFPTVVRLAGGDPPADRIVDGHDIRRILFDEPGVTSAYDRLGFFYYHMHQLQAVRAEQWKLYLPLENKIQDLYGDYSKAGKAEAELYDVQHDPAEKTQVAAEHPDIVRALLALADKAREDLGDWDCQGANQRPAGWVNRPTPRLLAPG